MTLINHTFAVADTETTGIGEGHKPVEVAIVLVKNGQITAGFTTFLNPEREISIGAGATHGLRLEHLEDAPTIEQTLPWLNGLAAKADAIVAHNAPFDRGMLPGMIDRPWLDTLRLSRKIYPEAETHTNQGLRYMLNLRCPEADGMPAHRALADCYVTARLLVHLLQIAELEEGMPKDLPSLLAWIDAPNLLKTCNFGEHKGTLWAEVPQDYLRWIRKQDDWSTKDPDLRHTVEHYLL